MTPALCRLAEEALEEIAATPRTIRFAARRGIVASTRVSQDCFVAFRRERGRVQMEVWVGRKPVEYELPPDLERRAAEMLDGL